MILSIIIIAVVIIVAIVFLCVKIKKEGLKSVARKFIVRAEKGFQYGRNSEKFNYVFDKVYDFVPNYLKIFITKEVVMKIIQKVFDELKEALDYKNTGI